MMVRKGKRGINDTTGFKSHKKILVSLLRVTQGRLLILLIKHLRRGRRAGGFSDFFLNLFYSGIQIR